MTRRGRALLVLAAAVAAGGAIPAGLSACTPSREPAAVRPAPEPPAGRSRPEIRWRDSLALGSPSAGRLRRGVQLPAAGVDFATWDPVLRRSPGRAWRRWGTDDLVRTLLRVARGYRAAHPGAEPLLIGDLSRRHGGDFGPRFGYIGHASHQNGLDADVLYPRRDGARRAPRTAADIDRRLSQELVDRFVRAGAVAVFVGPGTGLGGPPGIVQAIPNHDNHLHVRIRP